MPSQLQNNLDQARDQAICNVARGIRSVARKVHREENIPYKRALELACRAAIRRSLQPPDEYPHSSSGMGQLYTVTAPSGQEIAITPEEEAEIVKQAMSDKIQYGLTREVEIERAVISSAGTALGLAIGGFAVGLLLGRKR